MDTSAAWVRSEFRRRNPAIAVRPFIDADPFTLLAGLRQVSPDAAMEVEQSRAGGIMLRTASTAMLFGGVIALAEAVVRDEIRAVVAGLMFLVLALFVPAGGTTP